MIGVKMMTMSEIDKQFIDDNMLTDEDFHFGYPQEFENSSCGNPFKCLSNDVLDMNKASKPNFPNENGQQPEEPFDIAIDDAVFENFLKECGYEMEIKVEPSSPCSTDGSQSSESVSASEADFPVISIANNVFASEQNALNAVSDTPPNTPPSMREYILPDSPVNMSGFEPQIVSVSSMLNLPYLAPRTTQAAISTGKKIQPKPVKNGVLNGTVVSPLITNSGCKPVVLNSEQLAKLTNGTLKIKTPVNVSVPVTSILQTPNGISSSHQKVTFLQEKNNNKLKNGTVRCSAADLTALRRQQRMIKNRESACLSRKKKKEHVQKLEAEVSQVSAENFRLREENCRLRQRVEELENEIAKLRSSFSPKTVKKTACLMAVLFMVTFNFASFNKFFDSKSQKIPKHEHFNHHVGRSLLWQLDNKTNTADSDPVFLDAKILEAKAAETFVDNWDMTYNSSSCPNIINKTESLRLESDLLGWVQRVEKKQKQKESNRKVDVVKIKATLPPFPKLQTWSRHQSEHQKDTWAKRKNKNEILIYQTPRQVYEDFFDAIHRRDDTFYFVSFSGDHMLLPAISHNETHRPRMSIVMPAMTFNDSRGNSNQHISMMQIDCEVMNTKLVYIKQSVIPEHLRQKMNTSYSSGPKDDQHYALPRRPRALQKSKVKLKKLPSSA